MKNKYEEYVNRMQELNDIGSSIGLMHWDMEVMMPPKGAQRRAGQIATLSKLVHEMGTAESLHQLVKELNTGNLENLTQNRNVATSLKEMERAKKLPSEFVKEMSQATSEGVHAWQQARKANDFSIFAPHLKKIVDLKRKEAELVGYQGHAYNALLDEYEPDCTVTMLDNMFDGVKKELVPLLREISNSRQVDSSVMQQYFPKDAQWDFGIEVLKEMGYDMEAGRQDMSAHPFTINFSANDVRVTTRVSEKDFEEMLWSCIHEGGHALYEQGLPDSEYGLPSGTACSLGIHESQSRLWENNVGRSLGYWKMKFDKLKTVFPIQFENLTAKDFYRAMNKVEPSLIRTNADELTYHFHILIRYEIEKMLVEGTLETKDVPAQWNRLYKEYLGIDVPSDDQGCLQDVHWSHGSLGYFPTYSIGSFYAAQMYATAIEKLNLNEDKLSVEDLGKLREFLRTEIHQHGKTYGAEDLCEKVCGEPLNPSAFINYAKKKYAGIYEGVGV